MSNKSSFKNTYYKYFAIIFIFTLAFPFRAWINISFINSIAINDLILILLLFLIPIIKINKIIIIERYVFFTILFSTILSILSLIWTQSFPVTLRYIFSLLEVIVVYIITINLFFNVTSKQIFNFICYFVILLLLGSILSYTGLKIFQPQYPDLGEDLLNFTTSYYSRLSHPFIGLSNNFATVLSFFFLPIFFWARIKKSIAIYILSFVLFFAIVLTLSRGILLAMIITFVFSLIYIKAYSPLFKSLMILVGLIAFCGIFYFLYPKSIYADAIDFTLTSRNNSTNVDLRFNKIDIAYVKILNKPILGYGGLVTPDNEEELEGGVHNTFIQNILSFGILGLFLSLFQFATFFVLLYKAKYFHGIAKQMQIAFAFSVLQQFLTFLTQSSFEGSLLKILFYFSCAIFIVFNYKLEMEEKNIN